MAANRNLAVRIGGTVPEQVFRGYSSRNVSAWASPKFWRAENHIIRNRFAFTLFQRMASSKAASGRCNTFFDHPVDSREVVLENCFTVKFSFARITVPEGWTMYRILQNEMQNQRHLQPANNFSLLPATLRSSPTSLRKRTLLKAFFSPPPMSSRGTRRANRP